MVTPGCVLREADGFGYSVNEIGKLEDLPREQGSRIVALARTWYGDPSMTTMAVPKGKLFAGVAGSILPPKRRQRLRLWICNSFLRHVRGSAEANIA